MKVLKKLNIGLVLTIIVVTAVTIYSVNVEIQRNKEKESIKTACEDFIKLTSNYMVLPEKYQEIGKTITEEDWNKYIEEIKKGLKEKMIDNDEAIDIQTILIESELGNQISSKNIITKYEREISKISSYAFDGDQVTVTFKGKVNKDTKYLTITDYDYNGNEITKEETKADSFNLDSETITLQKIGDTWKVVYADLSYSDPFSMAGQVIMM